MKYIITDTIEIAQVHINKIEQHLGEKIKPGTYYTKPIEITSVDHEAVGKYIVKIMTSGGLKCDELFDSQDIVDFDNTWFPVQDIQSTDGDSEDGDSEDNKSE